MGIQERLIKFVTRANWILLGGAGIVGLIAAPFKFALGIIFGGLIVTINFHLLAKTLKKALTPPHLSSHNVVIAKYYIRFIISGVIIFILIAGQFVNPIGLILGLSIVVAGIMMGAAREITKFIFKEAV